jgi:hypothetical protein
VSPLDWLWTMNGKGCKRLIGIVGIALLAPVVDKDESGNFRHPRYPEWVRNKSRHRPDHYKRCTEWNRHLLNDDDDDDLDDGRDPPLFCLHRQRNLCCATLNYLVHHRHCCHVRLVVDYDCGGVRYLAAWIPFLLFRDSTRKKADSSGMDRFKRGVVSRVHRFRERNYTRALLFLAFPGAIRKIDDEMTRLVSLTCTRRSINKQDAAALRSRSSSPSRCCPRKRKPKAGSTRILSQCELNLLTQSRLD